MQARRAAEREKLLKLKEDLAKSGQVSGLAVGGDNAGDKKEKYNYYNDSDLESQMDDFKITEKSIDPSDQENSDQSEHECEHGETPDDDQEFHEGVSKVCKHMEHYYNKNYKSYNVNSIRNIY